MQSPSLTPQRQAIDRKEISHPFPLVPRIQILSATPSTQGHLPSPSRDRSLSRIDHHSSTSKAISSESVISPLPRLGSPIVLRNPRMSQRGEVSTSSKARNKLRKPHRVEGGLRTGFGVERNWELWGLRELEGYSVELPQQEKNTPREGRRAASPITIRESMSPRENGIGREIGDERNEGTLQDHRPIHQGIIPVRSDYREQQWQTSPMNHSTASLGAILRGNWEALAWLNRSRQTLTPIESV